jgi:hypothetical protein
MTSGGFGAVTGLLGGYLTKVENRKMKQLDHQHEQAMGEMGLRELTLEHTQALEMKDKEAMLAEVEGDIVIEGKEADAFVESIKGQGKATGIKFVDAVRGLMRPLITIFLLWVVWEIYDDVDTLVGGLESLTETQLVLLYTTLIESIMFLTTTAVAWWFASRGGK